MASGVRLASAGDAARWGVPQRGRPLPDKDGYEAGLPRERIGQRPVHFIVLLQSRRWQHELQHILRRLEWARPLVSGNVSKWGGVPSVAYTCCSAPRPC